MTRTEIFEALKKMTTEERLELIETASKMIREDIYTNTKIHVSNKLNLAEAAEIMRPFYEPGSELIVFADQDTEDFYEYEDYA
ncbi:hypothetical protein RIVM261_061770 [Rivularia sp. IAM M-261]|nr:hypothetical protein RIVM261_061770 [Rivularia sp. IAM M-261]